MQQEDSDGGIWDVEGLGFQDHFGLIVQLLYLNGHLPTLPGAMWKHQTVAI